MLYGKSEAFCANKLWICGPETACGPTTISNLQGVIVTFETTGTASVVVYDNGANYMMMAFTSVANTDTGFRCSFQYKAV